MRNFRGLSALLITTVVVASCSKQMEGRNEYGTVSSGNQIQFLGGNDLKFLENERNPLVREALEFLAKNKIAEASARINQALKLDPENSKLHLIKGLIYQTMADAGDKSKLAEAEVGYKLALSNDPSNYWANYQLGSVYFLTRNYEMAQQAFANGLLYHPDDSELLLALASSSYSAEDVHTAYLAISKLNDLSNLKGPQYSYVSALVFAASGDFVQAEKMRLSYDAMEEKERPLSAGKLKVLVDRWQQIHSESLIKHDIPSDIESTSSGSGRKNENEVSKLHEDMLYIDVIILRSEESSAESKGINLMNGLQMSFSGTVLSRRTQETNTDGVLRKTSAKEGFSPEVSIPGVNYMLNIFNNFSTKTEIIGRPTIVAMDGRRSEFHSGSELHIALTPTGNSAGARLEEIPVGVVIEVEPNFVSEDKTLVDLEVNVERTFIENGSQLVGFGNFAQMSKNGISANVRVALGETLILGGLSERESTESGDKVKGIGDVPLLGQLFSERQSATLDKSVVIMMTPRRPVSNDEGYVDDLHKQGSNRFDFLGQLKRETSWTTGDSNLVSILDGFKRTARYSRGFRTDDLPLEEWQADNILTKILTDVATSR